jgi:hypothetical protein
MASITNTDEVQWIVIEFVAVYVVNVEEFPPALATVSAELARPRIAIPNLARDGLPAR